MLYNYPWPKDELGVRDAVLSFTDRLQVRNEDQPEPRIWAFNHHTRAEIHLKQFTPSLWLRLWIIYIELCQIIWLWRMLKSDRCTVHRDFYVPVSMQHSSYISSTQKTLMLQCFFFIFIAAERAAGCHSSLGSDWPQPTVRMPALQAGLCNITQGSCAACEWSCSSVLMSSTLGNSPLLCSVLVTLQEVVRFQNRSRRGGKEDIYGFLVDWF